MAATAGALSIGKFAGKCDQPVVCVIDKGRLVVTGMAGDAATCCKGMSDTETVLFSGMTLRASIAYRLAALCGRVERPRQKQHDEQVE